MSVEVKGITKYYGAQKAVDNLSFVVRKGEVLGFLGPNGAGKSTTMKIITGFIPANEGRAMVCDMDVATSPIEVKRKIGYLPEHNPLYKEMYVKEYLTFIGRLYSIAGLKDRIDDVIDKTGLGKEADKLIGALSKGYRQRVGLAQALLHDPEVLILDEPTSGLDPNQLIGIRKLIKELGTEKTIIFSTHIMQEVKAVCDRVIIISEGKMVADDPIELLSSRLHSGQVILLEFDKPVEKNWLTAIEGIVKAEKISANRWQAFSNNINDVRPFIFQRCVKDGVTLLEMHSEQQSVEDVFQQLTQEHHA